MKFKYRRVNVANQKTVVFVSLILLNTYKHLFFFLLSSYSLYSFLVPRCSLSLLPQQPRLVHCSGYLKVEEVDKKDEDSFKFIMDPLLIHCFVFMHLLLKGYRFDIGFECRFWFQKACVHILGFPLEQVT